MKSLIASIVLSAWSLTATGQNQPAFAIAYNVAVKDSAGKSNYEVFSMDMDGHNVRNVSAHKDVAWTYKAYQKDLYFISDRDTCYRCFFLYKTDFKGKNPQKVSDLQLEDSWMSFRNQGKEAVVSGRKGRTLRYQLFFINTETGAYRQITSDTAAMYVDPSFSPDGKQIALSYRKNRRDRTQNEEIYLMNPDGTQLRQVTTYPQKGNEENENGYKAGSPRWHPSGKFISYISMLDGMHNIYAITPDGKKQWKLTTNKVSEGWHDWSPDGQWLAFDATDKDQSHYEIMLMNWKTKVVKQLTTGVHKYQQAPVFVVK